MLKKLRVVHFPQMQSVPFIVKVNNLEEAKFISDVLADYDLHLFNHNLKPDYSNMTIIEQFDEKDKIWVNWFDEITGIDDLDEYFEYLNRERKRS